MEYYVVIRNRHFIDAEYIMSILHGAIRPEPKDKHAWSNIFGPYSTLAAAEERLDIVLSYVDDDDYGIFSLDKSGWRRVISEHL